MAVVTWNGITFNTDDLKVYGWFNTKVTVGGTIYPLLTGMMQAAVLDCAASVAASAIVGGPSFTADLSSTADADPGAGKVRFNHADQTQATSLYVDLADSDGSNVTAFLDALDDSTSTVKGILKLQSKASSALWVRYTVGTVTSASGYRKVAVTYLDGPGGITANSGVVMQFSRTGDKGDTGTSGAQLDTANTWTAGQRAEITALTDQATITPDFAASNDFSVTLGGNRTMANPTNIGAGQSGVIHVTQDGTGSRTLSWGSYWDFQGGTAPTLSTAAGAVDTIAYTVRSATSIVCTLAVKGAS